MTAPAPQLSRLARSALAYAERGWHVFPLQVREKLPLIKGGGGFLAATSDADTVKSWWRGQPNANIGLWPGQSGLLIIDLDGPEGEETGRQLGLLSEPTLQVVTGRQDGGRHLYFKRPDFPVSNAAIGKKIDVRCDAGYVILPPSVHPSGRKYEWLGKADEIHDLPPQVVELLRRAQTQSVTALGGTTSAKDIALEPEIASGERNNSLTRYAGRLLAKGISDEETLALVSALNQAKCKPPLPQHEINALVAGIARREEAKRKAGAASLSLVTGDHVEPRPDPRDAASKQIDAARAMLVRDISAAPRWTWPDVDNLAGVMLPGELHIVGALMGNGKSSFLMTQMEAFAAARQPTLYIPLEIDPEACRLRWASWKLELDYKLVVRQEWARLPEGSCEAVDMTLEEQEKNPLIQFAPDKRITLAKMVEWCTWAKQEFGCRVVMLDHFHRMEFGANTANHRVSVTDAMRRLKDLARELGIVLIAAVQLNRSNDPLDFHTAPLLARIKESAGIAEEADVVLMLSRRLKRDLPQQYNHLLKVGQISERDIEEPGHMVVTCRKHRLDDSAMNHAAFLVVVNGRVQSKARPWRDDVRYGL